MTDSFSTPNQPIKRNAPPPVIRQRTQNARRALSLESLLMDVDNMHLRTNPLKRPGDELYSDKIKKMRN